MVGASAQPQPPDPSGGLTFEEAYQELQEVLGRLEEGGLHLEASVRLFERGMELAAYCEGIVDRAELRVTRLVPDEDAEGAF